MQKEDLHTAKNMRFTDESRALKLLIVTPYLPYPPNSGGRAAQFSMLKAYPPNFSIRLIYKAQAKEDAESARLLEEEFKNLTVILCDPFPESGLEPAPSEKPSLALKILRLPARITWKLLFLYESLINKLPLTRKAEKPLQPAKGKQPQLPYPAYSEISASLLRCIQENLEWADLVQSDFIDLLTLSSLPLNSLPKVFVAHQVHTSYVDTYFQSADINNDDKILNNYHQQLTRLIERTFLDQYDAILVFSDEDKEQLKSIGVDRPIHVSPYTFPLDLKPVNPDSLFEADWKPELVFIGSGEHGPNEQGLEWFLRQVYPILDSGEHGYVKPHLTVIGSWSLNQRTRLEQQSVHFSGFVDDLSEAVKGRVCICPILIGAGLRTKLLAAAMCSSPIVSTSLGCQGIGMQHARHCLIADSPSDFAAQVMRLLKERSTLGAQLAANAFSLVKNGFSLDVAGRQREEIYNQLLADRIIRSKATKLGESS
jgi:glycosyltransferase involved in cell wall biosynthesis